MNLEDELAKLEREDPLVAAAAAKYEQARQRILAMKEQRMNNGQLLIIPYRYQAKLVRAVDGDTFDLVVDVGFHGTQEGRFRLYGANTPEIRGPQRPDGLAATQFVLRWFDHASAIAASLETLGEPVSARWPLVIDTHKDSKGKYGRWLADVYNLEGQSLAQHLINNNHAEAYTP